MERRCFPQDIQRSIYRKREEPILSSKQHMSTTAAAFWQMQRITLTSLALERSYPAEPSVKTETFYSMLIWQSPNHMLTTEHLDSGWCDWGPGFFILFKLKQPQVAKGCHIVHCSPKTLISIKTTENHICFFGRRIILFIVHNGAYYQQNSRTFFPVYGTTESCLCHSVNL